MQKEQVVVDSIHPIEMLSNYPVMDRTLMAAAKVLVQSEHSHLRLGDDLYFNKSTYMDNPVTADRVQRFENEVYIAGLHLTVDDVESALKDAQMNLISLHKVSMQRKQNSIFPEFVCDCKAYMHNGIICSHIIAALHLTKTYSCDNHLLPLEAPAKRGRKKQRGHCLSRNS